ncbi:fimbrial protein [Pseudomonas sp. QTF5]|uniref:fimbrial protein n=1 Tax=Pseudomonas sp. QTF5 TaxID=1435425 RepID=UPI0006871887|nr:fimbrial protein [Pseudomonas sp. QTF5]
MTTLTAQEIIMKLSINKLVGLLGFVAGFHHFPAQATPNSCDWRTGAGTMTFHQNLGSVFVPRDAPVGSVIGRASQFIRTSNNEGRAIICENDGNVRLSFNAHTSVPLAQGLLLATGTQVAPNTLMQTNIPGVGVQIKLLFPFDNSASNAFVPDFGDSTVPFSAHHQRPMGAALLTFSRLESRITLIKTGQIPPGPQTLNGQELFSGSFSGITGKAFGVGLIGTVVQAHCGTSQVSADPVQLGDWDAVDFSGPGYTTTAVPFKITLASCVTDGRDINIAYANIHLEGASGSQPATPSGVFSLTADSSAEGMGIQILRGDGLTPVELEREVPLKPISNGDTVLDFTARYYQLGASSDIRAGSAKGALNFTLTYK